MLLRNRLPAIESQSMAGAKCFEAIDDSAVAIIAWLNAHRVDYVVVGAVARIVRGDSSARGPVAIVPAPYGRNLDRLADALAGERARIRTVGEPAGPGIDPLAAYATPVKLSAEKLVGAKRWTLRCGSHELDIEGHPAGAPRYQELLYEAAKFELIDDVAAEIASPEHIEHHERLRRTGTAAPEIRVTRAARVPKA